MKKLFGKLDDIIRRMTQEEEPELEENRDEAAGETALQGTIGTEIVHAEPGAFQAVKGAIKGHGEQTVLPDDCQFGDNDLCYVDA